MTVETSASNLFQEKTISEIKSVQKQLRNEIERKKEELRTMVGERYRDLIEAADMISDMKETSAAVVANAEEISVKCKQMHDNQLVGHESKLFSHEQEYRNNSHYSIAVQIKLLVEIPELIWCAMDMKDYILGAQLFLLARYIYTGLQLQKSINTQHSSASILTQFPIMSHHWNVISRFHSSLLSGCYKTLKSHDISIQTASNCLGTVLLLEDTDSLELLKKFLDMRMEACESILTYDTNTSVKTCIWTVIRLILQTISVIHGCFYDDGEDNDVESVHPRGLLWKKIKTIVGNDAVPSVKLVDLDNVHLVHHLPSLVQEFKPSVKNVTETATDDMQSVIVMWLDKIHSIIKRDGPDLLATVGSICSLYAIQQEVPVTPDNWKVICQHLSLPRTVEPWMDYFEPLMMDRARVLISKYWNSVCLEVKNKLKTVIDEVVTDKSRVTEYDMHRFIWTDSHADGVDDDCNDHGLHMNIKGYTPTVEKICLLFDAQLGNLVQDFTEVKAVNLEDHLQFCAVSGMKELVEFIRSSCPPGGSEVTLVLMARFLAALCDLVPNLRKCLTPSHLVKDVMSQTPRESSQWPEVCNLLQFQSTCFWQQWQKSVTQRIGVVIKEILTFSDLLQSFPKWETVNIIEEAEENRRINSAILIPSQPSLPLQSLLHIVSAELCQIAPHTLPRRIHQDFVECLLDDCLEHYNSLLQSKTPSQSEALQFLHDIKYLTTLLMPRDNKVLVSKGQSLSERIEELIDPFDLDVFGPYIQNNIKLSVQRSHILIGIILPWAEKFITTPGRGTSSSDVLEDPSILPVCAGIPWFPLLPVTGTPSVHVQQSKPQLKNSTDIKKVPDSTSANIVRTSASAVFNVLSSDWFGPA